MDAPKLRQLWYIATREDLTLKLVNLISEFQGCFHGEKDELQNVILNCGPVEHVILRILL